MKFSRSESCSSVNSYSSDKDEDTLDRPGELMRESTKAHSYKNTNDTSVDRQIDSNTSAASASKERVLLTREKFLKSFKEEDYSAEEDTEEKVTPSEATEIVDFMRNAWKLPTPELIISVTGGAKLFEIVSPHVNKIFQQDLVSAATPTSEPA